MFEHEKSSRVCSSSATIVIWVEAPFKVLAADRNEIFGFLQHELVGETVEKLAGPLSDTSLFRQAIARTSSHCYTKIQMILYSKNGKEMQFNVSCEPLLYGGIFVGCLTVFKPFQAVSLQKVIETFQESQCAQCLISADAPHEIQACNEAFAKSFGCRRNDILGQPVTFLASVIHGSDPHSWRILTMSAVEGTIIKRRISSPGAQDDTSAGTFEEAFFVPVVEDLLKTRIRHILILFQPPLLLALPPVYQSPGAGLASSHEPVFSPPIRLEFERPALPCSWTGSTWLVHDNPGLAMPARPPCPTAPAFSAGADSSLEAGVRAEIFAAACGRRPPWSIAPKSTPEIRPRRRIVPSISGAEGITPLTVVFTPALLEDLRGQPLPAAARSIGVSATAFTRACRRLGLRRWPFRRGPARSRGEPPAPPPA